MEIYCFKILNLYACRTRQGHHMAKGCRAEDLLGREMVITHDKMEGEYRCRVF